MRTTGVLALTALLLPASVLLGAQAASAAPAADTCSDAPNPAWDQQPITVEYGEYWAASVTSTGMAQINPYEGDGSIVGAPAGYKPFVNMHGSSQTDPCTLTVNIISTGLLPPGSYTLKAGFNLSATDRVDPPAPLPLTVAPAALGITARIAADTNNSRNAIVTTRFTGDFVTNFGGWGSTTTEGAPITPGGTWKVVVADSSGAEVVEYTADRSSSDDVFGASWIWLDAPAGEYSATATFTPTGASTKNFAFTPSDAFAFTAAGPAAGDAPTASPAPTAPAAVAESGPTLPGWIPLTAGVITVGLLALTIVQTVRIIRRRRPALTNVEMQP